MTHRNTSSQPDNMPRPGRTYLVTRAASCQFVNPILFRLIRISDKPTYHGWAWLEGYQVNSQGAAILRREIFVQPDHLFPGKICPAPAGPRATAATQRQEESADENFQK